MPSRSSSDYLRTKAFPFQMKEKLFAKPTALGGRRKRNAEPKQNHQRKTKQKKLVSSRKTKRSLAGSASLGGYAVGGRKGGWLEEDVISEWASEGEWGASETSWGHGVEEVNDVVAWEKKEEGRWAFKASFEKWSGDPWCRCWNTTDYSGGKLEVECHCQKWTTPMETPPRLISGVQRV